MMDFVKWISVLAAAFQLLQVVEFGGTASILCQTKTLDSIEIYGDSIQDALVVSFVINESGQKAAEYVFIPWQNFYLRNDFTTKFPVQIDKYFRTVNDFTVIYEINTHSYLKGEDKTLLDRFSNHFAAMVEFESNEKWLRKEDACSFPNGINLIRLTEYPHYVVAEAALPGSKVVQPFYTENLPEQKMIQLFLVPDQGPVKIQWLAPLGKQTDSLFYQVDKQIADLFLAAIQDCIKYPDLKRTELFEIYLDLINDLIEECNCIDQEHKIYYPDFLKKLMLIPKSPASEVPELNEAFTDYEPKNSRDVVTDFMPSLMEDLLALPTASINHLDDLLKLFTYYEKEVKMNPGKWVDGNMVLGANPKEYEPSKSELLLDEIGERIQSVISENKSEDIRISLKRAKNRKRKISYRHFTFTHVDVMGSGRFFYVNQVENKKVELITPIER